MHQVRQRSPTVHGPPSATIETAPANAATSAVPASHGLFNPKERQSPTRSTSATLVCNQSSVTARLKTRRQQQRVTDYMTHCLASRPTRHMTSLSATTDMAIRQHHVTSGSDLQGRPVQQHAARKHTVLTSYPSRPSSSYCTLSWNVSEAYRLLRAVIPQW